MLTMTRDQLYDSLMNSRVCPACGRYKKEERSLCYEDFCRLPPDLKERLYRRFGHGYEQAMSDALAFLRADRFHA